jgi:ribonuclease HI
MNDTKHIGLEQIQFKSDSQMLIEKLRTKWRDNL